MIERVVRLGADQDALATVVLERQRHGAGRDCGLAGARRSLEGEERAGIEQLADDVGGVTLQALTRSDPGSGAALDAPRREQLADQVGHLRQLVSRLGLAEHLDEATDIPFGPQPAAGRQLSFDLDLDAVRVQPAQEGYPRAVSAVRPARLATAVGVEKELTALL